MDSLSCLIVYSIRSRWTVCPASYVYVQRHEPLSLSATFSTVTFFPLSFCPLHFPISFFPNSTKYDSYYAYFVATRCSLCSLSLSVVSGFTWLRFSHAFFCKTNGVTFQYYSQYIHTIHQLVTCHFDYDYTSSSKMLKTISIYTTKLNYQLQTC